LAHAPAVALLEGGGLPGHVEVVNRAGAALEVHALVGDLVGDDDVVLRGDVVVVAGTARAVEGLGNLLAQLEVLGVLGVEDGDAGRVHAAFHQQVPHPVVARPGPGLPHASPWVVGN